MTLQDASNDLLWSSTIAIGREEFVEIVKDQLQSKAKYKESVPSEINDGAYYIKEPDAAYILIW